MTRWKPELSVELLKELPIFAYDHHILDDLTPHLCLVNAMMAQLLGHHIAAVRYYEAGLALLQEGSELALMVEASLYGTKGLLADLSKDHLRQSSVKDLAARCKKTSSMVLSTIGQLLSALAEDKLMLAK